MIRLMLSDPLWERLLKAVGESSAYQTENLRLTGDKGYDSEALRSAALDKGIVPHIPRKSNSQKPNPHFDKFLYRHRHLVENLFQKLKHFRAFATRYDKRTRNFISTVFIVCMLVWLNL